MNDRYYAEEIYWWTRGLTHAVMARAQRGGDRTVALANERMARRIARLLNADEPGSDNKEIDDG